MMERLTAYDRPIFGRADNMVLGPLTPAETAHAIGLDSPDAIDLLWQPHNLAAWQPAA